MGLHLRFFLSVDFEIVRVRRGKGGLMFACRGRLAAHLHWDHTAGLASEDNDNDGS